MTPNDVQIETTHIFTSIVQILKASVIVFDNCTLIYTVHFGYL